MIRYKIDVPASLKERGIKWIDLRNEGLGEGTLTRIRHGEVPSMETLDVLCRVLRRQPASLIEWVSDDPIQPLPPVRA